MTIQIPGGTLTVLPAFLPAPASDVTRLCRWAAAEGLDGAAVLLEWAGLRRKELRQAYDTLELQQLDLLTRIRTEEQIREKDRRELRGIRDRKRYAQEVKILRANIDERTDLLQELKGKRNIRIAERNQYQRLMQQLERNRGVIGKWQRQQQI